MAILLGTDLPSGSRGPVGLQARIVLRQSPSGPGPGCTVAWVRRAGVVLALCTAGWLAVAAPRPAPAERTARVVHVTDGDTVWVEMSDAGWRPEGRIKLRIDGIDAPESCQSGGPQAQAALAQRVLGQTVTIRLSRQDAYARWLGRLYHEGEDIGAWMVSQGWAWNYRFASGRGPYDAEERQARQAQRGLFAHTDPMPPRVFRQWHGPCR